MIKGQKGAAPILLLLAAAVAAGTIVVSGGAKRQLAFSWPSFKALEPSSPTQSTPTTSALPKPQENNSVAQARIEKYLTVEAALLGISDNYSLYFKDLAHQKEVSFDSTRSWIPASTIKAFVVLEAYRQRRAGLIDFDQLVTIKASNVVPTELETDDYPRLREGTTATVRQLVEAMIVQSDNSAYNTLLDILDRRNINQELRTIGITETVVGEKLNLDDAQYQEDLQTPGRAPNTTTAKDLSTFFDLLYNKKLADSDEILAIFKRQKINNMIPALLPANTQVAHKTGDWAPIYHDSGVVFKPDDPFILTVFTNSGDPSIISRLAKVAYYQSPDVIGRDTGQNSAQSVPLAAADRPVISLADSGHSETAVLGEETSKFPTFTASDLGITTQDISISQIDAKSLRSALVPPGSLFYGIKRFFEDRQITNATDSITKARAYLAEARSRISEVKGLLSSGQLTEANKLLTQSEEDLRLATELAKADPENKDLLLTEVKQVSDLHFAILSDRGNQVTSSQKEQYVDLVYDFYKKQHQDVAPTVNASALANPTQQKPAVATISQISGNKATITFEDGSSKQMVIPDDTKVRSFGQTSYGNKGDLQVGNKIAVVGLTNSNSTIIPQFILKNVPKELPDKHEGTVIEINPSQGTLKVLDKKGQESLIRVDPETSIKSKDTSVSLEGIKAGSEVTYFGVSSDHSSGGLFAGLGQLLSRAVSKVETQVSLPVATPSPTTSPVILPTASSLPLASAQPQTAKSSATPAPQATETNITRATSGPVINAVSVTVTNNSSGSKELIQPSGTSGSGPASARRSLATPAPVQKPAAPTSPKPAATPVPTRKPGSRS